MIEVRRIEDMGLVLEDLQHLHRSHWDESESYRNSTFAPRYDLLQRYWELGMIRAWGAFDGSRLIGHLTVYVSVSVHTGEPIATEDALYVLPEFRKGAGSMLVKRCIEDLTAEGLAEIWATCRPKTKVGTLLERKGFAHVADTYLLRLQQHRMH